MRTVFIFFGFIILSADLFSVTGCSHGGGLRYLQSPTSTQEIHAVLKVKGGCKTVFSVLRNKAGKQEILFKVLPSQSSTLVGEYRLWFEQELVKGLVKEILILERKGIDGRYETAGSSLLFRQPTAIFLLAYRYNPNHNDDALEIRLMDKEIKDVLEGN